MFLCVAPIHIGLFIFQSLLDSWVDEFLGHNIVWVQRSFRHLWLLGRSERVDDSMYNKTCHCEQLAVPLDGENRWKT
jgi:hypothetical protein